MESPFNTLRAKLAEPFAGVRVSRSATGEFTRVPHAPSSFALVTLSLEPSRTFDLTFVAEPSEPGYRQGIEDGVIEYLLTQYQRPVLGISVRIDQVVEDELRSSYNAFKLAAQKAIAQTMDLPDGSKNIQWE